MPEFYNNSEGKRAEAEFRGEGGQVQLDAEGMIDAGELTPGVQAMNLENRDDNERMAELPVVSPTEQAAYLERIREEVAIGEPPLSSDEQLLANLINKRISALLSGDEKAAEQVTKTIDLLTKRKGIQNPLH